MRLLFLNIALFFSLSSFATSFTPLTEGDTQLFKADAKVLSIMPICKHHPGEIACMAVGSKVEIEVTLNGCLDRMGGYFSSFKVINEKGYLNFAALNIANKASLGSYCALLANTEIVTIYVPYEGKIEFVNSNFYGLKQSGN